MREQKRKCVGIMGGTFDPIHVGHLILAEAAYDQLGLDEVLFIPAGRPPHKKGERTSGEDRAQMVRLAIAGNDHFSMSLMEIEAERYSYTYLTLEKLRELNPFTDYIFLIGEDSLRDFSTWVHPELIASYCKLAVFRRGNKSLEDVKEVIEKNQSMFGDAFLLLDAEPVGVSSTNLRKLIGEGRSVRYYVPEGVYEYIQEKGLYGWKG